MVFWKQFADVTLAGESVYRETVHPYGPVWVWLVAALEQVRQVALPAPVFPRFFPGLRSEDPATYDLHFLVVVPLTLADLVAAWVLARRYDRGTAAFFYLSPTAMYITGYHSQIDGLAVTLGLLAALLLGGGRPPRRPDRMSPPACC
jgi:hypothetical protein